MIKLLAGYISGDYQNTELKIALYSDMFTGEVYSSSGEVATGVATGYVTGGKSVGAMEVVQRDGAIDLGGNINAQWKNSNIAARSAVVYHVESGIVLYVQDFGEVVKSVNDTFSAGVGDNAALITWEFPQA